MLRLEAKTAVITGASTGIGRAIASTFAAEGARIIINYHRSKQNAEELAQEIANDGGHADVIQADVADEAGVKKLVDEASRLLGGVDVWANVAGADILTGAAHQMSDLEKLERLIAVDLRGTMLCSWRIAERMRAGGGGSIINMGWDLAIYGMEGRNPEMFAAVKAGILGFSKCLARSYAPEVRVNIIAPGWIETAFARDQMSHEYYQNVRNSTPLKRFGTPKDVAAAALFLASDESAFITGQTVNINGGSIG